MNPIVCRHAWGSTPSGATRTQRFVRSLCLVALLLVGSAASAQTQYSGRLGTQPIHVFAQWYSDGVMRGAYSYDKYDTPIEINGKRVNGTLDLIEKDADGHEVAILRFADFDPTRDALTGTWMAKDGTRELPITLTKSFEIEPGHNTTWPSRELLQASATREHYFKAVVSKDADSYYPRVTAIKVIHKGTDVPIQTLKLDVELRGIDNVYTGDFNFDGIEDISVFEASYAGPNTTMLYFLRSPDAERYDQAEFSGVSLSFDAENKLVYEHNQCCGGRSHQSATYKVVGNRLEMIEQRCIEYDETQEDHVEVPCSGE